MHHPAVRRPLRWGWPFAGGVLVGVVLGALL
jgi:F0F1-type ATP synthase assembly protein I